MTPPTRKKEIRCGWDAGPDRYISSIALIPNTSNIRKQTAAIKPKPADQIRPFTMPTGNFDRERPMAPGSFSIRCTMITSTMDSRQRINPRAGNDDAIHLLNANLNPDSIKSIAAIEIENVFSEILFASTLRPLMLYMHTSVRTSCRIFQSSTIWAESRVDPAANQENKESWFER